MPYIESEPYIPHSASASIDQTIEAPLMLDRRYHPTGIIIDKMAVRDGCEEQPGREDVQRTIAEIDKMLVNAPGWLAPVLDEQTQTLMSRNPASDALYGDSVTLHEWYVDAAHARATALYPLQRPDSKWLPSGAEIDEASRAFFNHGLDAIGIRTRAKLMTDIVSRRLDGESAIHWVSLACGAAVPVVDALQTCSQADYIHVDLIDMNESALNFAADLMVNERGLVEVAADGNVSESSHSFSTHKLNLIRGLISSDSLVDDLGEGYANVVDALGIFEYFSEKDSIKFLRNAYRLLGEGGTLVIANMLSNRPQMDFNVRGVGWPKLYPRSIDELASITHAAGIDPSDVRILIPEDGVYAVVEIIK